MSGSATQHPQASRYDKGKTYDSGFKYDSYTLHKPKRVVIKVYNNSDVFQGILDDVVQDIKIVKNINGGLEPLTIKTTKQIDNFDQGSLINYKNIIRIYLTDAKNTDQIIYTGFISSYEPYMGPEGEGTNIQVLPNIAQLAEDFFRVKTDLEIAKNSMEISLVIQDIIEKYQEKVTTALVTYPSSIRKNTGNTISYTFKAKKTLEAIKKCGEFLDNDWYWYVQPDGQLKIDQEAATADLTLTIGRNIKSIRTRKTIERVVNKVIFWNGREANDPLYIYNDYNNDSSQSSYGIRSKFIKDGRVTVSATADLMANRIINKYKDPKIIADIELTQDGINLATIEPGQTVNIRNIDTSNQTTFDDNLIITRVEFDISEETARIELSDRLPDLVVDNDEDIDLKLDRLVQDIEDRLTNIGNTNLSIRVRANTAIVSPTANEEQFSDIQEAIDWLVTQGGGILLLKEGVFDLTSSVTFEGGIIIKGEDPTKSIINLNGYNISLTGQDNLTDLNAVDFTNGSKTVTGTGTSWLTEIEAGDMIKNNDEAEEKWYVIASVDSDTQLTLVTAYEEANDSGANAVTDRREHDFALLDFQVRQGAGDNIKIDRGRNFFVNNVISNGTDDPGNNSTSRGLALLNNRGPYVVSNCIANNHANHGIEIASAASSTTPQIVRDNECRENGQVSLSDADGISLAASNIECTGNVCEDNQDDGIAIGGSNCRVNGNQCRNNEDSGVDITGDENIVNSNQLTDNDNGVSIRTGGDENIVTSNNLRNNTSNAWQDAGSNNIIADNNEA